MMAMMFWSAQFGFLTDLTETTKWQIREKTSKFLKYHSHATQHVDRQNSPHDLGC